jgi:hypothetical protein
MRSLFGAALALAILGGVAPALAMTDYKWKYRPLVVFAKSEELASLAEQRRIVAANRAGLAERNVVVIWVIGDSVAADFGPHPGVGAEVLRNRFGAGEAAFRALLIGKDGGTKISSAGPLGATVLNATIDSMPMRRNEMRRP